MQMRDFQWIISIANMNIMPPMAEYQTLLIQRECYKTQESRITQSTRKSNYKMFIPQDSWDLQAMFISAAHLRFYL